MGRKKADTGIGIMWYILAPLIIEWAISLLVKTGVQLVYGGRGIDLNQYATEFTTLAAVITIPVMVWMYCQDRKKVLLQEKKAGKKGGIFLTYTVLAVMGISACIAMNTLLMMVGLPDTSEKYQTVSNAMYTSPIWIQLLGLGVLIPAKEELVYRAVFYRRMRGKISVKASIIITSVIFGAGHGNLVQFFFAAVLGALLAGVYERSASVYVPVFLHSVINLTSLILTWNGWFTWMMDGVFRAAAAAMVSAIVAAVMFAVMRRITGAEEKKCNS